MDGWTLRSMIRELTDGDGNRLVPDELYTEITELVDTNERNERLLSAYKQVVGHMAR